MQSRFRALAEVQVQIRCKVQSCRGVSAGEDEEVQSEVQRCKKDQRYRGAKVLRRFSRGHSAEATVQRPQCRGAEAVQRWEVVVQGCRCADVQSWCRVGAEVQVQSWCRGAEVLRF